MSKDDLERSERHAMHSWLTKNVTLRVTTNESEPLARFQVEHGRPVIVVSNRVDAAQLTSNFAKFGGYLSSLSKSYKDAIKWYRDTKAAGKLP